MTGRFTQQDPIGLAGGLNLYGFAGGDPVNFSDPFGLDPVSVACREIPSNDEDSKSTGFAHCAIRIGGDVYELRPDPQTGLNNIHQTSEEQAARYDGNWVDVAVPNGMSEDGFSAGVLSNVNALAAERNPHDYGILGNQNSNRFVYDAITRSGGRVPFGAVLRRGVATRVLNAVGLCGATFSIGRNCAGVPRFYNRLKAIN